jgi:hypothetical protein
MKVAAFIQMLNSIAEICILSVKAIVNGSRQIKSVIKLKQIRHR